MSPPEAGRQDDAPRPAATRPEGSVTVLIPGVDAAGAVAWVYEAGQAVLEMLNQVMSGRRSALILPSAEVRIQTWELLGTLDRLAQAALSRGETTFDVAYEFEVRQARTVLRTHCMFARFLADLRASGEFSVELSPAARVTANRVNAHIGAALGLAPSEIPVY